jgi:NitT/TauT family transport system substrate-binding protein
MKRLASFLTVLVLAACSGAAAEPVVLRFGVLPIIGALPLYVADSQGYFAGQGIRVEFIPVSSAAERDQLMQAGQIDGMINDLVSTILYNQESVRIATVRFAGTATATSPQYAILARSESGIETTDDLRGVPIGISQGTVIDYVTHRLLEAAGLTPTEIVTVAVPTIPERMNLLASGQIEAATLPEPFATLAIQSGAVVVIDDTQHPDIGNNVFSFRASVLEESPDAVRGFLAALEQAIADINADKSRWSDLLTERQLVPAPLVGSYEIPDFPAASVPNETQWQDVLAWMQLEELVFGDVPYAGSVDASFLPEPNGG